MCADARPLSPPHWRLAYDLIGLADSFGRPTPAADHDWPAILQAYEDAHGPEVVRAGLRIAATYPTVTGWTKAGRDRAAALLPAFEGVVV